MFILLTHSKDEYCCDLVAKNLEEKGYESLILYTDAYPIQFQTLVDLIKKKRFIIHEGSLYQENNIDAVWIRKWASPGTFGIDHTAKYAYQVVKESEVALNQFMASLSSKVFFLDPIQNISNAENKLKQLETALRVGLKIPETLISNHPTLIKDFIQYQDSIVKMQTVLSWGMEGNTDFFYTQEFKNFNHIQELGLEKAPLTFQEKVNKHREFRSIFVDGLFFNGVVPNHISKNQLDWRTPGTNFEWETAKLPEDIEQKLTRFMQKMNLKFGAIDILETLEGNYVFLEVNPIGEWGMLEKFANLPISEAIANALIKNGKQKNER